uniref:Uncharacterized protein n=1 Tax=Rhizophora mucronata TaxID=61149 RepID=A0A2P2KSJ4_RHIMU
METASMSHTQLKVPTGARDQIYRSLKWLAMSCTK